MTLTAFLALGSQTLQLTGWLGAERRGWAPGCPPDPLGCLAENVTM